MIFWCLDPVLKEAAINAAGPQPGLQPPGLNPDTTSPTGATPGGMYIWMLIINEWLIIFHYH